MKLLITSHSHRIASRASVATHRQRRAFARKKWRPWRCAAKNAVARRRPSPLASPIATNRSLKYLFCYRLSSSSSRARRRVARAASRAREGCRRQGRAGVVIASRDASPTSARRRGAAHSRERISFRACMRTSSSSWRTSSCASSMNGDAMGRPSRKP